MFYLSQKDMFSFISLSFDILSLVTLNGMACFPCIKHTNNASFTGSSVTVFKGEQAKCNLSAEFHFFPRRFHFFLLIQQQFLRYCVFYYCCNKSPQT